MLYLPDFLLLLWNFLLHFAEAPDPTHPFPGSRVCGLRGRGGLVVGRVQGPPWRVPPESPSQPCRRSGPQWVLTRAEKTSRGLYDEREWEGQRRRGDLCPGSGPGSSRGAWGGVGTTRGGDHRPSGSVSSVALRCSSDSFWWSRTRMPLFHDTPGPLRPSDPGASWSLGGGPRPGDGETRGGFENGDRRGGCLFGRPVSCRGHRF